MTLSPKQIDVLNNAQEASPHDVLGMHPAKRGKLSGLVVRCFIHGATGCDVVETATGKSFGMECLADTGLFEVFIPRRRKVFPYQLRAHYGSGEMRQFFDPYSFLPTLGEQDLYLFNEGNEHRIYQKLGAHVREIDGVKGVAFAVWAPSAKRVSVVGNFNHWDGRYFPMRSLGSSGVWELFIPGLKEGELYKFELLDQRNHLRVKTDPYGTYFEAPPGNASIVHGTRNHAWGDQAWMEQRAAGAGTIDRPISIYEVHLGSWKRQMEDGGRPFNYRELAPMLADYALEMGFTHIEVMPLAEHPFEGSWGYQVTGFYAPTHRFGSPDDFAFFVDHLHQRGLGIILDWVPAHFPRDTFALAEFDGTHLYEHADPRQGAHMDWGTLIFNFGRNEVRCFLVANALAWLDRYHIDGLRVDAVASMLYLDYSRNEGEWIPNRHGGRENLEAIDFLRETNRLVHDYYPGVLMIAEESTAFAGISKPVADGGIGFDFKWNMGWMHDTLSYFQKDPIHRKWHQNELTFGALYQWSENFVTVFSHDEVVHGKNSMLYKMGAWHIPEKAANLRALYAHMWGWPGKKCLFMGCEFGQSHEWKYAGSLDWDLCQYIDHEGVRLLVKDLNHLYRNEPALSSSDLDPAGFRWVAAHDTEGSVISYLRQEKDEKTLFLIVGHFTPQTRENYRIGAPRRGRWREVINSNSEYYGGSGLGNGGEVHTQDVEADGFAQSLALTIPPLSTTIFKWSAE
ncbi:1,4-alpha-glucan branching protein GlgB [Synoicihabitans lomoniglobus]|uniref:1,4-alpha-glucan branching enzyme GlgB n=1 Tax=Synoicihabitans lomoniglobus TaxID=2909285 RepID=A0AAF0CSE8_9BACT|nr:1,4-alpha-glucan branching protein GlgB [Opitutaceae bacterium LMO-M01]WED67181.1 1,4-alpha-glucan branching protein GlgB [Opitutaceae bacterium LMO-M01]